MEKKKADRLETLRPKEKQKIVFICFLLYVLRTGFQRNQQLETPMDADTKSHRKILLPLTNRTEKGSTAKQDFETITTLLWANNTGGMVALPSSPPARPSYSSEDLDSVHLYDLEVIEVLPSEACSQEHLAQSILQGYKTIFIKDKAHGPEADCKSLQGSIRAKLKKYLQMAERSNC